MSGSAAAQLGRRGPAWAVRLLPANPIEGISRIENEQRVLGAAGRPLPPG